MGFWGVGRGEIGRWLGEGANADVCLVKFVVYIVQVELTGQHVTGQAHSNDQLHSHVITC